MYRHNGPNGPITVMDTEYAPGNMTRYSLIWQRTGPGSAVLTWANAPWAVTPAAIPAEGYIEAGYLGEKLNWDNDPDLAPILAWLRDNVGYRVDMPAGYDDAGLRDA